MNTPPKKDFTRRLLQWYQVHKRDLPWRQTADPYVVWLSEIILQQTRVEQGQPYFQRFIESFPKIEKLANAPQDQVMRLWQGLGYYSRARNLHAAAKMVADVHKGQFPATYAEILKLPGVGPYTAAAIASFCFGQPHAVVDGNVYRVLSRVFGITEPVDLPNTKKQIQALADEVLDTNDPATHNQAIMEFGALHCKPANPDCGSCIFQDTCQAFGRGLVAEIPAKAGKNKITTRYFNYLVIHDIGKTLIRKRNEPGIWRDLFEPPMVESSKPLTLQELKATTLWKNICMDPQTEVLQVQDRKPHKLSHQTIYARVYFVKCRLNPESLSDGPYLTVGKSKLRQYAVPRLIEQVFEEKFTGYGK
ncbi:MAG: A/G-specific adenine glycosylase [Bacteroidota bacterium]